MMPGGQHQHEGAVQVPDQGQDEPGQEQEHDHEVSGGGDARGVKDQKPWPDPIFSRPRFPSKDDSPGYVKRRRKRVPDSIVQSKIEDLYKIHIEVPSEGVCHSMDQLKVKGVLRGVWGLM